MIAPSLLAALALAAGHAPRLSVAAYAVGRSPDRIALPAEARPGAAGEAMLGSTYRVRWSRSPIGWRIEATRTDEGKYWRLALEASYPASTTALTLTDQTLPVRIPLAAVARKGQAYWTWTPGAPNRLAAESPTGLSAIIPTTRSHHGFWVVGEADGTFTAQFGLDAWTVGAAASIALELSSKPPSLPSRPDPPAGRSTLHGLLKVDPSGAGFIDGAGRPWFMAGRNQHDFVAMSPAAQVAFLRAMRSARMNTLRILVQDTLFRPLPGVWNADAIRRLRPALDRCAAHGIRASICLELSGCGYQYSVASHLSPAWSDLYLHPEARRAYADLVRRIVRPLRNHPAVASWGVTNEPDIVPDPASVIQAQAFRAWVEARRGPGAPAQIPTVAEHEAQSTQAARDFREWSTAALADALIDRAQAVRAADPAHLITLSAWDPRLFADRAAARVFDYWSPHTYDLWLNGPLIERHVYGLLYGQRRALSDHPRPVVIEEFGMSEAPERPEALRAEHVRQFVAAARRLGLAGILHWWDMSPALLRACEPPALAHPAPTPGRPLAVWLPPSHYAALVVYGRYMDRRRWEDRLWAVREAGFEPQFVTTCAAADRIGRLMILEKPAPGETDIMAGSRALRWSPEP